MAQNNLGISMRSATRTRPNRPPRLTVELPADLFGELEQMAEDQDRPLSALCRRLLTRAVEREQTTQQLEVDHE